MPPRTMIPDRILGAAAPGTGIGFAPGRRPSPVHAGCSGVHYSSCPDGTARRAGRFLRFSHSSFTLFPDHLQLIAGITAQSLRNPDDFSVPTRSQAGVERLPSAGSHETGLSPQCCSGGTFPPRRTVPGHGSPYKILHIISGEAAASSSGNPIKGEDAKV